MYVYTSNLAHAFPFTKWYEDTFGAVAERLKLTTLYATYNVLATILLASTAA
jgi:hypothetical protein